MGEVRITLFEGIAVGVIPFEAIEAMLLELKGRIAAPAGVGKVFLGGDESRGREQTQTCEQVQPSRIERAEEGTDRCVFLRGHAVNLIGQSLACARLGAEAKATWGVRGR